MKKITKDFNTVIKVLRSCKTSEQLIVAENMWDNFCKMYENDKDYFILQNIQFEEYFNKIYEIQ